APSDRERSVTNAFITMRRGPMGRPSSFRSSSVSSGSARKSISLAVKASADFSSPHCLSHPTTSVIPATSSKAIIAYPKHLNLTRILRARRYNTDIRKEPVGSPPHRISDNPFLIDKSWLEQYVQWLERQRGKCDSSCSFIFMGGITRSTGSERAGTPHISEVHR